MDKLTKLFDNPNTTLNDVNTWLYHNDMSNMYKESPAFKRAIQVHLKLYAAKQEEQNLIKEKQIQDLEERNENRRKSLKRPKTPRDAAANVNVNPSGDGQSNTSNNVAPQKKKIKKENS